VTAVRRIAQLGGTTNASEVRLALALTARPRGLVEGPAIEHYEGALARAVGADAAITFGAGRVALFGMLRALGVGAGTIELNTALYSDATLTNRSTKEAAAALEAVRAAAENAQSKQMQVLAGHGLTYRNVRAIADIPQIVELNIGHNIIARAALVGLDRAVRDMLDVLS